MKKTLKEMLVPGRKIKDLSSHGKELIHIRAIIDEDQIVYAYWRGRRGWKYEIATQYWFELLYKDGELKDAGVDNYKWTK